MGGISCTSPAVSTPVNRSIDKSASFAVCVGNDPASGSGMICHAVAVHDGPVFRHQLRNDLVCLGVRPDDVLLVHAAMSAVGWICGGASEAVHAMVDAVGPDGTIVVPTQTPDNRDPSRWTHYPAGAVPQDWWPGLREHIPPFDKRLTPSIGMGAIAERVR